MIDSLTMLAPILGLEFLVVAAHRRKGRNWVWFQAYLGISAISSAWFGYIPQMFAALVSMHAAIASELLINSPWWRKPLLTHQRTDPWHLLLSWVSHWPYGCAWMWFAYGPPIAYDGASIGITPMSLALGPINIWWLIAIPVATIPWVVNRPANQGKSFWDPR